MVGDDSGGWSFEMSAGIRVFIVFGVVFGVLAALVGSLVTANELGHHRLERWAVFREASRVAVLTFLVFVIVTIVAGLVLLPLFHVELYPGRVPPLP